MKKTKVQLPQSNQKISYRKEVIFLGSCFAEHLSEKMKDNGFTTVTNPFGVVFNPMSLAALLLTSDTALKNSVFMREDVALSWLTNSTVFAYSAEELQAKLIAIRAAFLNNLKSADFLFVTFGTAWVYRHKSTHLMVANCHKVPAENFEKTLLKQAEIVETWERVIPVLKALNPTLQVVFTLSPVRHVKDGVVANARSKAILLCVIHELMENNSSLCYFPAYEIVLDELRDYAYFSTDGVHPNALAIDQIWAYFKEVYFSEETEEINKELRQLKQELSHRLQHPLSEQSKQFKQQLQARKEAFQTKYPFVRID